MSRCPAFEGGRTSVMETSHGIRAMTGANLRKSMKDQSLSMLFGGASDLHFSSSICCIQLRSIYRGLPNLRFQVFAGYFGTDKWLASACSVAEFLVVQVNIYWATWATDRGSQKVQSMRHAL